MTETPATEQLSEDGRRIPKTACPYCKCNLDSADSLKPGERPKPTDYTICSSCAMVMQFDEGMGLRKLTADDWLKIVE